MCLQLHGVERIEKVLDPFMGIGNTAVACTELGLDCVGFEIDTDYCAQTKEALKEATEKLHLSEED